MTEHPLTQVARPLRLRTFTLAAAALFFAAFFITSLSAQTQSGQPAASVTTQTAPPAATTPAPSQPAQSTTPPASTQGTQPNAQAASADPGSTSDAGAFHLNVHVNEVNLIFTVTDRHGHYIPNLKQSDFALLDDQKAPVRVNSFHQQINLPLRVGILIDTSSSIRSRFQFEQQSATDFLQQVLRSKADRAFVMGFDVTPTVTTDWTNDQDALETGVNKLRPEGGTALFDAVYVACRDKLLSDRAPEPVRKAIILITDGEDNQSRVYLPEAIKECERAETIIYAISTNWTPSRGEGDKVLQKLAED
ncbi:MAG: VWA domain-containing protein, partial [Terracidiphilus sp.]